MEYGTIFSMSQNIYTIHLSRLYDTETAVRAAERLTAIVKKYENRIPRPVRSGVDQRDAVLITYADQIRRDGEVPLRTLHRFCSRYLSNEISAVHVLPFFPWSSDDGFSVKDYRAVESDYGDWEDLRAIGTDFKLMADGVINHASVESEWFQSFLRDEKPFQDYFLTVEGRPDLSQVVRPRTTPLLTEFQTAAGPRQVWTTFSADQADLNYRAPDLLLEIIDILLFYAAQGVQIIRLDAIAFLWKEIGTRCMHLPQTHAFVQLLRAVFESAAPHVQIITETNVPHEDNMSYFGDGTNEAHLVYNFALPLLVLHTLLTGDCSALSNWAWELTLPSAQTTFFNFLASHDGIGLNPARGILSEAAIEKLADACRAHGGEISYKQNPDGSQSPYELNISYFDALSDPNGNESLAIQVSRFMAAYAIALSVKGVPGIYFHSMIGSRNWAAGPALTGQNRSINREKISAEALESELGKPSALRSRVLERFRQLLHVRAGSTAFDPYGDQRIMNAGPGVFAVLRSNPQTGASTLCLQNVTNAEQTAFGELLQPYQTRWIGDPRIPE